MPRVKGHPGYVGWEPMLAACQRCGRTRQVHPKRPAPLCRDCRDSEMVTCECCGVAFTLGGISTHRRFVERRVAV